MKKYLTWRCVGLTALVSVLVPTFLLAGWWQYHVALGGNELSWVYTVEWPFFAVYAVYIWWRLIHDQTTPFDRLWLARQRAAADEDGRPLHEIPGWATDKALAREVRRASLEAARRPALASPREALGAQVRTTTPLLPAVPDLLASQAGPASSPLGARHVENDLDARARPAIDVQVLEVKAIADEELDAYNRYLFELSKTGSPKRWGSGRRKTKPGGAGTPG
ncbi:MAG: hypothetical protein M0Z46_22815 [Actinomycetota bacterium]|nr:hypothetical protein [Actinomycetota bacterium]